MQFEGCKGFAFTRTFYSQLYKAEHIIENIDIQFGYFVRLTHTTYFKVIAPSLGVLSIICEIKLAPP